MIQNIEFYEVCYALNQKTVLHEFLNISLSLSRKKDIAQLLENIPQMAMRFTNADAGSMYLVQEDATLNYEIVHTKS